MLDLFFRKYAWAANLVLLFAAAWLAARTVNTLVGAAVRPRPAADLNIPAGVARPAPPVNLDDDKLYKLIGVEKPPPEPDVAAEKVPPRPQNCDDPRAAPVKSDLRVSLVAAVMAEPKRYSLATLADLNTRQTFVAGIGEPVLGARLLGFERLRDERDVTGNGFRMVAVVCNGGTKEYVEAESAETYASAGPTPNLGYAPVPAPRGPGTPGAAVEGVRTTGQNKYEIDRNVLEGKLNNLSELATQARIVPNFKNNAPNGFKLIQIAPGSLYSAIGIESGDVVQRINGYELNSPEKALELYAKLREAGRVTLELERGGQVIRKEYTITGP